MGEEQEETKDQTAPAQQVKFPESEMPKTPEKLLEMPQGTEDQEEVTQESEETIPEGSTGVSDDVTEIYADMGGASDEREAYEEEMLDEGEEPKDEEPEIAEQECQTRSRFQCTKIERQDLARLIRREWQLANNSFLLHGYYNYHHLAFLQEGEKLFLGVPGVYSEKERRAAQAFGFPGFVNYDEEMFSLPETEREEKDDFGYWCRQVHQIRVIIKNEITARRRQVQGETREAQRHGGERAVCREYTGAKQMGRKLSKEEKEHEQRLQQELQAKLDMKYMKEAMKQARKAYALREVPIGCIIVYQDKIIGRGYNRRTIDKNTLAHAELQAIRKASRKMNDWRLEDCTMYVTLEPCQMCSGAIVQSRMTRVVVGCMNPKAGCAGSILNLLDMPEFNHQVELTTGVMEEECSQMMKSFFKELREARKKKKAAGKRADRGNIRDR